MDLGKLQTRYSFERCGNSFFSKELFFAINHKEPGEHFKAKNNLNNDPVLLNFDFDVVLEKLAGNPVSYQPAIYPGYELGGKSLRGR